MKAEEIDNLMLDALRQYGHLTFNEWVNIGMTKGWGARQTLSNSIGRLRANGLVTYLKGKRRSHEYHLASETRDEFRWFASQIALTNKMLNMVRQHLPGEAHSSPEDAAASLTWFINNALGAFIASLSDELRARKNETLAELHRRHVDYLLNLWKRWSVKYLSLLSPSIRQRVLASGLEYMSNVRLIIGWYAKLAASSHGSGEDKWNLLQEELARYRQDQARSDRKSGFVASDKEVDEAVSSQDDVLGSLNSAELDRYFERVWDEVFGGLGHATPSRP